jgi:SAM-dependent methyltransferase
MHETVKAWFQCVLLRDEVFEKDVAEVGARDVNGSIQNHVFSLQPGLFTGIDIQRGPRVNKICDAKDLPSCGRFDAVLCAECLDHCEDWKSAVTGMITALNPGGIWMLTTRSPGFPYHRHPEDYWRFTIQDMTVIAAALGMEVIQLIHDPDPRTPGVFIKARKPADWSADCIDLTSITVAEVVKDGMMKPSRHSETSPV